MWFSGTYLAPPCLLDLDTMQIVARVPQDFLIHLVAVKADGTLFLRQRRDIARDRPPVEHSLVMWKPQSK